MSNGMIEITLTASQSKFVHGNTVTLSNDETVLCLYVSIYVGKTSGFNETKKTDFIRYNQSCPLALSYVKAKLIFTLFYFVLSFYCCILASNASETKAAPKSTPKAGGGGGLFDDESGDDDDDPFSAKAPVKQEVPEEKSPPKKKVRFKDCSF